MKRREMLLATAAAAVGASTFPFRWVAAAEKKKQKVLYFTRSAGFVHSVVNRGGAKLAHSEKILTELGKKPGFEVVCSQEESVFDGDLDQYDLIAFFTSGKAISGEARRSCSTPIHAGKGFVGFHAATDTFRTSGLDPYIAMIGGEFLDPRRSQQKAMMKIARSEVPRYGRAGRRVRDDRRVVYLLQVRPRLARGLGAGDGRDARPAVSAPAVSGHLGPHVRQGPRLLHLDGPSRRRVDRSAGSNRLPWAASPGRSATPRPT